MIAIALAFLAGASPAPLDAATIVERHLAACGGADKLRAISSVRETGHIVVFDVGRQTGGPAVTEEKRPNKSRAERTMDGVRSVWAFDGRLAWSMRGDAKATPLGGEQGRGLAENEFDHFLLDHAARGISVELIGMADVDGRPAHKLRVVRKNGEILHTYLDARSFLEVKRDYVEAGGTSEQWFRGHRVFSGVTRPTVFVNVYPQSSRRVVVTLDTVEINPTIDDARFRMPATGR